MTRKDTSLRSYLEKITGGKASGTGACGGRARPLSIVEAFQIRDMAQNLSREEIVRTMREYYGNKWMGGFTDHKDYLEFFTNDEFKPEKKVRVILDLPKERPHYCRASVERTF